MSQPVPGRGLLGSLPLVSAAGLLPWGLSASLSENALNLAFILEGAFSG